jgi:Lon protease-like protein
MTGLPMFPLGSVLFPYMPLSLRVFEERYVVMLSRVLQADDPDFGVVLIERGQEVGGGEHRFSMGTMARIRQIEAIDGVIELVAEGMGRVEVTRWLDDDPHPYADVRKVTDLRWSDEVTQLRDDAERTVRRTLARASEFADLRWSADVGLADDPVERAWQLAAIAPLGPIDQMTLLASGTLRELLETTIDLCVAVDATLEATWEFDDEDDD